MIFINGTGKKDASERLEILNRSNDGFFIASEDLKLRGPGILGDKTACNFLAYSITFSPSTASLYSTVGQIIYACLPSCTCFSIKLYAFGR